MMSRRYEGFKETFFLWKGTLEGLEMIDDHLLSATNSIFTDDLLSRTRLGKLVEQFVFFELRETLGLEILQSNLQVFDKKITVGELDLLMKTISNYYHVEIVYKYYLYDPAMPGGLNCWIGPNRNDSLVNKLNKLKTKQFPLLHHPETVKLCSRLVGVDPSLFLQRVYFKAQLFVPFYKKVELNNINPSCVSGRYLKADELAEFSSYLFYVPEKLDWLVQPFIDVHWMSYEAVKLIVNPLLLKQKSPLCWLRAPNDVLTKVFITWW